MASVPSKKRKLNDGDSHADIDATLTTTASMLLNTPIDAFFDDEKLDTSKLEKLSQTLEILQKETTFRLMNSVSFERAETVVTNQEKLSKLVKCVKSYVNDDDVEANNYHHVTSYGKFEIGPNKTVLEFNASLGDLECSNDGNATFGNLWSVYFDDNTADVNISLDEIKKLVKQAGIKGISETVPLGDKDGKDWDDYNDYNDIYGYSDDEYDAEEVCKYGYHRFAYDLSRICLKRIEKNDEHGCGWMGDVEDFPMGDLWKCLRFGDFMK